MKKNKKDIIKLTKKISRENDLLKQKNTGKIFSKSWGGKPNSKESRRISKINLKKEQNYENDH